MFILIFSALGVLRGWYKWKYRVPLVNLGGEELRWLRVLRTCLAIAMVVSLVDFFILRLGWMNLGLGPGIRYLGAGISTVALVLLGLVHRDLGKEFSTGLEVQVAGSLITTGVYKWMRHPMYTVYVLLMVGGGLLSNHGGFFLFSVTIILSLMILRVPYEEAMLAREFGDQWAEYAQDTGRFLPFKSLGKQIGAWFPNQEG